MNFGDIFTLPFNMMGNVLGAGTNMLTGGMGGLGGLASLPVMGQMPKSSTGFIPGQGGQTGSPLVMNELMKLFLGGLGSKGPMGGMPGGFF